MCISVEEDAGIKLLRRHNGKQTNSIRTHSSSVCVVGLLDTSCNKTNTHRKRLGHLFSIL